MIKPISNILLLSLTTILLGQGQIKDEVSLNDIEIFDMSIEELLNYSLEPVKQSKKSTKNQPSSIKNHQLESSQVTFLQKNESYLNFVSFINTQIISKDNVALINDISTVSLKHYEKEDYSDDNLKKYISNYSTSLLDFDQSIHADHVLSYTIYPNPTNGILNLPIEPFTVRISSAEKDTISNYTLEGKELDLSKFNNGIYYLHLVSNDCAITKKIEVKK